MLRLNSTEKLIHTSKGFTFKKKLLSHRGVGHWKDGSVGKASAVQAGRSACGFSASTRARCGSSRCSYGEMGGGDRRIPGSVDQQGWKTSRTREPASKQGMKAETDTRVFLRAPHMCGGRGMLLHSHTRTHTHKDCGFGFCFGR